MRVLAALVLFGLAWPAAAGDFRSIAADGTPMYDAPSIHAKKLFVASRFYPVEIVINTDNWVKVRDPSGDLTWVEKKAVSDKRTVIVTGAVADIRQGANDQTPLVFRAKQGVALDVVAPPSAGWIRVRHTDGQTGYVRIIQVWGQ
jgi:SH3-like domain-containing protein